MPAAPTSADRAAEFNRLIVEQATITRAMKYGHTPDVTEQTKIDTRAARLHELAELLGASSPGNHVNERIATWLRMNPLPLGARDLHEAAEVYKTEDRNPAVYVTVGDIPAGGYMYRAMRDDLRVGYAAGGGLNLLIPESVAEHFRRQGRRALQGELRDALNVPRA